MAGSRIDDLLHRVQSWLSQCGERDATLARLAGVDGKTIRLARQPGWSPTATILRKMEGLVPDGWEPVAAEPSVVDACTRPNAAEPESTVTS